MQTQSKQTAVLYFTRSAAEEAHAKSFCSSADFARNRAIAQHLIDHTWKQINKTELPVRVFTSASQKGTTFGEKLGHAFQTLFDEGYQNVIAVGNDCLDLSACTLQHTVDLLEDDPLVVGPTTDGGTYLIGINREAFALSSFSSLAWQTKTLLEGFSRYARSHQVELTKLCLSMDIDNEEMLRRVLHKSSLSVFYARLILMIQSIYNSSTGFSRHPNSFPSSFDIRLTLYHRGPPRC